MAATDQHYRHQKTLDIVFAVSCVLMLVSLIWMFADDYLKRWKTDQKIDRKVQSVKAQREGIQELFAQRIDVEEEAEDGRKVKTSYSLGQALDNLQRAERNEDTGDYWQGGERKKRTAEDWKRIARIFLGDLTDAEVQLTEAKANKDKIVTEKEKEVAKLLSEKAKADLDLSNVQADYNSIASFYDIAIDERDEADPARRPALQKRVDEWRRELDGLWAKLATAKARASDVDERLNLAQEAQLHAEQAVSAAEKKLKDQRGNYERFMKLARAKRWGLDDTIASLPILDAFKSSTRIDQITLNELPIDYSFKYVTRMDRCMTCHLGMDRINFDKVAVRNLAQDDKQLQANWTRFRKLLQEYKESAEARAKAEGKKIDQKLIGGFDLDELPETIQTVPADELTESRINEFCSHPRLDLFVEANSPHPVQKFGCTICHSGQGSATDFVLASHTPNDAMQRHHWEQSQSDKNPHGHDWNAIHDWDYPMLPKRFTESGCIKCHHQVTDMIRYGNRIEAPKVIRGYELIKDNGCFGCHEIAGIKNVRGDVPYARSVGPDLRLELNPPLEVMPPADQAKILADKANPPGTLRKVGPSLARITEKTNESWLRAWLKSPRGFRPDTKMPHFYGLSNNHPDVLPDSQKHFPAAEIDAIAYYLFRESRDYLDRHSNYLKKTREELSKRQKEIEDLQKKDLASAAQKTELFEIAQLELMKPPVPLVAKRGQDGKPVEYHLIDGEGRVVGQDEIAKALTLPASAQVARGGQLFREKGCLACHLHDATWKNPGSLLPIPPEDRRAYFNNVEERQFGPNLSRVAAKLGKNPNPNNPDADGRIWLIQWLLNPTIYHPRSRMPITHLDVAEADAIARWLLTQDTEGYDQAAYLDPAPERDTLKNLTRVYLVRMGSEKDVQALLELTPGDEEAKKRAARFLSQLRKDADEQLLAAGVEAGEISTDTFKLYLGKKAINRLGCYGCHNIPGFELAKPIGTPLNDWGRKRSERLAFEGGAAFAKEHYHIAHLRDDPKDPSKPAKDWVIKDGKTPMEEFFYESLEHHHREGFLHLKLAEPRSYDYHRDRTWDDRLRMPQFRFSRKVTKPVPADADPEEKQRIEAENALIEKEEAEAREAVMTFVLGLVAEQVPAKYVNQPTGDRAHEVRGRQVLDKYNCAGCHQVRSGVYEFTFNLPMLQAQADLAGDNPEAPLNLLKQLRDAGERAARNKEDYLREFPATNAWVGQLSPYPGRLLVHGFPTPTDSPDRLQVGLAQAVRFQPDAGDPKKTLDIPAGVELELPAKDLARRPDPPYGGIFMEMMASYLEKARDAKGQLLHPNLGGQSAWAKAALPPPLLREGERVQPDWLYRFLRNPGKIRPQEKDGGIMVLRMPRFNMSDDEAMALVNYFAAADRLSNPGEALNYPYQGVPQRDPEFWRRQSRVYEARLTKEELDAQAARLEPIWKQYLADLDNRLKEAEDKVKEAEKRVEATEQPLKKLDEEITKLQDALKKDPKDAKAKQALKEAQENRLKLLPAYQEAERTRKILDEYAKPLRVQADKDALPRLKAHWLDNGVYGSAAYQLLVQRSPCLECHQASNMGTPKGPPLDLSAERLRPEWTLQWLANPRRLTTYDTPMPQNFARSADPFAGFKGSSRDRAIVEQMTALRDLLMNYPDVADRPANRYFPTTLGGKGP